MFEPPGAARRSGERVCEEEDAVQAVFLHGLWRSGSTFLWQSFRAAEETRCFYEPLHHGLAKITRARIVREGQEARNGNGHSLVTRPYFAEFGPLVQGRGVRGHKAAFAVERFHLEAHDHAPRLEAYIRGLVRHAHDEGLTPVLGFNRTVLRLGWLRPRFCALNLTIERDPAAVWASYRAEQAKGNDAFFVMWLRVLERNAATPAFAPLADALSWPPRRGSWGKAGRRARAARLTDAEGYLLVAYVNRLACWAASRWADARLNETVLADPRRRREVEELVWRTARVGVDLSAYAPVRPRAILDAAVRRAMDRLAETLEPDLGACAPLAARGRAPATRRCGGPGAGDRVAGSFAKARQGVTRLMGPSRERQGGAVVQGRFRAHPPSCTPALEERCTLESWRC